MGRAPVTKMVIPSKLSETQRVTEPLFQQIADHDYPEKAVFAIRLSVDEALTNAIRHGNCNDPEKQVAVEWAVTDKQVRITVTDEGCGFHPDHLPDPTESENLTRPCGRGVMLMQAYMTDVKFNKRGNQVTMIKDRDCVGPSAD
ncbi:ATP-binding protein [Phycisphaerales bacterium AB-hyl4]|uniref:ATP-binding protein n=1 Tax=Natronomicrosphaera hydrolytica TaxID=3242702 RepID=A0ABV4U482_9BACT